MSWSNSVVTPIASIDTSRDERCCGQRISSLSDQGRTVYAPKSSQPADPPKHSAPSMLLEICTLRVTITALSSARKAPPLPPRRVAHHHPLGRSLS